MTVVNDGTQHVCGLGHYDYVTCKACQLGRVDLFHRSDVPNPLCPNKGVHP